jgi:hypothetical protein
MTTFSPTESAVRSRARRLGFAVSRSRRRNTDSDNHGQFMLCDAFRNTVVLGDRYDSSLANIAEYLAERAAAGRP